MIEGLNERQFVIELLLTSVGFVSMVLNIMSADGPSVVLNLVSHLIAVAACFMFLFYGIHVIVRVFDVLLPEEDEVSSS